MPVESMAIFFENTLYKEIGSKVRRVFHAPFEIWMFNLKLKLSLEFLKDNRPNRALELLYELKTMKEKTDK